MPIIKMSDVSIAYRDEGPKDGVPIILIQGLSMTLLGWHQELVDDLIERGFRVIRLDNRDAGKSSHLDQYKMPNLAWMIFVKMLGFTPKGAPYLLVDMAVDVIGLLDALGISKAHIAGVSMGGMIAQRLAIDYPERILSFTSIMSTTGENKVSRPRKDIRTMLLSKSGATKEERLEKSFKFWRAIGSSAYKTTDERLKWQLESSYDRGYNTAATARQLAAIICSKSRSNALKRVSVPGQVIHGDIDPLVPVEGGYATATALEVEPIIIRGMGHDLPLGLLPRLAEYIASHAMKNER